MAEHDDSPKKRVLIADDEQAVLRLLEATLGSSPRYALVVAHDGKEALGHIEHQAWDLVILDVRMPHADGFQVCAAIRQSKNNLSARVVILTALAREEDRQRAILSGADAFLNKPFSPTGLLKMVDELLFGQPGASSGSSQGRPADAKG